VPKRIHQIKDFSGGLNELQDAADIRDNQLSHVQNLMFNIHGSIGPAYLMSDTTEAAPSGSGNLLTRATYSNPYITSTTSGESVQPGYGLGRSITQGVDRWRNRRKQWRQNVWT
jgi:predicted deacetylase